MSSVPTFPFIADVSIAHLGRERASPHLLQGQLPECAGTKASGSDKKEVGVALAGLAWNNVY